MVWQRGECGCLLQRHPRFGDVVAPLVRQGRDLGTTMQMHRHQAFLLEQAQCLPDRHFAEVEFVSQLRQAQSVARLEGPLQNLAAQCLVGKACLGKCRCRLAHSLGVW